MVKARATRLKPDVVTFAKTTSGTGKARQVDTTPRMYFHARICTQAPNVDFRYSSETVAADDESPHRRAQVKASENARHETLPRSANIWPPR